MFKSDYSYMAVTKCKTDSSWHTLIPGTFYQIALL